MASRNLRILILPGLDNSGPAHWQSLWQLNNPFVDSYIDRVQHSDWSNPVAAVWNAELRKCLLDDTTPTVLVAHSLGCMNAAAVADIPHIKAALLVAPANPARQDFPERVKGFTVPTKRLPFPSILVASDNDPYATLEYSKGLARTLGSLLVNAGPIGHINADSKIGEWDMGQDLLGEMLFQVQSKL